MPSIQPQQLTVWDPNLAVGQPIIDYELAHTPIINRLLRHVQQFSHIPNLVAAFETKAQNSPLSKAKI